jgi:hypothetical protein
MSRATSLIPDVMAGVPDYQVFLRVDELNESSKRLAAEYPETVTIRRAGMSRAGDEIPLMKIGHGPRSAFLFGCPHPNEPIGTMMLEYLTRRLAEDACFREELGYTWYVIKCIDPDGTRRNEGWFKGPFTPTHYARNFYRPASFEQTEWTFPIKYKTLDWQTPIPETRALMDVIREVRPDFMFSLHNSGFGGVYYYVSDECPPVYPVFAQLARDQGLPLSLGEPEMPYARTLAPAIFAMPSTRDSYEYHAEYGTGDPAAAIPAGTSSFDFAREHGTRMTLVCEMPYFYDRRIDDTSPTASPRRQVVLEAVARDREFHEFLSGLVASIGGRLTAPNPYFVTLGQTIKLGPKYLEAKEAWARRDPSMDLPATQAQVFDNLYVDHFYRSLSMGMVVRGLDLQLALTPDLELQHARDDAASRFETLTAALEKESNYTVIPIKKLVSVQLGAALHMADYLRT